MYADQYCNDTQPGEGQLAQCISGVIDIIDGGDGGENGQFQGARVEVARGGG